MKNVLLLILLSLFAATAAAYEIRLDIDTDDDPATINDLTYDTTAIVKVALWPGEPDEVVTDIVFGLGGNCVPCDGIHNYGVWVEWGPGFPDWTDYPGLAGSWDGITLLGCPAELAYHEQLEAHATGDPLVVSEPVFIGSLLTHIADPPLPYCRRPASILAAFQAFSFDLWNYVQLDGPAIPVGALTWQAVKAIYR